MRLLSSLSCFQDQIAAKQQMEAMERARAGEELIKARQAEQDYEQRTMAVLQSSNPQTDFRRKKVEYYT